MKSAANPELARALRALAEEWSIPVTDAQAEGLLAYANLLVTWSARINLTGATSVEQLIAEHLPDSFVLAAHAPTRGALVDVGSGGGLPALPLALLRPDLRVTLVEPIAKKVAFLRTAIRELALGERVAVRAERAEALRLPAASAFDAASSRATLAPVLWAELGATLVRPGGTVFVLTAGPMELPASLVAGRAVRYLSGRRQLVVLHRPPQ